MITIARFSFPYEAHIARAKLECAGLTPFIADEHTINMQWLYSNAMGGVRLQVPQAQAEAALELLAEEDDEANLIAEQGCDTTACPNCQSYNTEYYQFGRRWTFLSIILLDLPVFPIHDGIKCRDCGACSKTAKPDSK
ncbi:DUF2007 domain-containing protein [Aliamphritea ceti]|uniref:DUF2007 domain-containing protein n=1 Tax=Aliamphritea ceti TaxID=1524258 RepID=UPI0021C4AC21|nr:DUF2007 domain-containing protein [Aliamphritea ceti]